MTIAESWAGAAGVAHGGVLAAALDEALGYVVWALGHRCATARLEVDYLAPVPVGSRLWVTARGTAVAGRKLYAEAEATIGGPTGVPAVRAAALFVAVRNGGAQ
ncbi:hotdog domain-containing protein [Micromonospora sp. CPCC 206060]|uniref:PaaI family thioesterase n=1 Tax=Micromonospora sp. CPCC 206060 TaxID=3122406 RepID=UPI002FEF6893